MWIYSGGRGDGWVMVRGRGDGEIIVKGRCERGWLYSMGEKRG